MSYFTFQLVICFLVGIRFSDEKSAMDQFRIPAEMVQNTRNSLFTVLHFLLLLFINFETVLAGSRTSIVYFTASYITCRARRHHVKNKRDVNHITCLACVLSKASPILLSCAPTFIIVTEDIT